MTARTRVPHEADILADIADGASIEHLTTCGRWSLADVTDVLRRNKLAVDKEGRVQACDAVTDTVLSVLAHSRSLHTRRRAVTAQRERDALLALFAGLQTHHGEAARVAAELEARNRYIDWLRVELDKEIAETRALKTPAAPTGEAA